MKRIIGIDVSGSSVKVCELIHSRKGVEIVSFLHESLKDNKFSDGFVKVLREKIARGVKVYSAVPAGQAILRTTVLPFKSERKIKEVVRFEAERYLPFAVEEAVVDFYIIGPGKDGMRIMLVTVRKEFIEKHLSLLRELGTEPEIIDLDSMALLNLLGEEKGTFALVDIGCCTTSISIVSGGVPQVLRSIPIGGNNLTEALSKDTIMSIADEISYTISAFSLQKAGSKVQKIVLSGGGAKLENFPEFLKGKLGLDVVNVDSLRDVHCNPDLFRKTGVDEKDIRGSGDAAVGLALRGVKQRAAKVSVNLKEGLVERAFGKKSFVTMIVLVSAVILLGFSTVFMRLHWKRAHLLNLEGQIIKVFKETFSGSTIKPKSSLEVISLIRHRLGKGRKSYGALREIGMPSTLELLRELSVTIPESIGIDITDIRLNGNLVQIEGETDSFRTIEKLTKKLSSSDYFRDVRVNQAGADSLRGKVKFRLDILVRSKDEI